ncbi:TPA: hypothetical protein HA361_05515 [Candidatus Woesearchaeota archaeon]|nr:hypothetical protein [Candidatus Woesearchaeota archaeon]HII69142.1 hypothetical protein [Candidatus Woesearchaeota archaeon]
MPESAWDAQSMKKAHAIRSDAHASKTRYRRFLEEFLYWTALAIIAIGNFLAAVAILPLLYLGRGIGALFGLLLLALALGLLFEVMIRDIQKIDLISHRYMPYVAAIIAGATAMFLFAFAEIDRLAALGFGVVYAALFITPYLFYRRVLREKGF